MQKKTHLTEPSHTQSLNHTSSDEHLAHIEQRLTGLETTISFLDDTVEQLNQVIANQDIKLATQERLIEMLAQRLGKGKTDSGIEPFNTEADRPPHY